MIFHYHEGMTLKQQLLYYYACRTGSCISGPVLGKTFQTPEAVIREVMSELAQDGFPFRISGQGYFFEDDDTLSEAIVRASGVPDAVPVYLFDEIDSTNLYARKLAEEKTPAGTLVIADHQSAGRGRRGHSFYSPARSGLYFSAVIYPETDDRTLISRITPAAAVAAAEAIAEVTGIEPGIKWVNDLYLDGRKIAGILCEAVRPGAVIIGIGINCRHVPFPDEIKNIAGSLGIDTLSRSVLAGVLWKKLMRRTGDLADPDLMEEYRRRSAVLGKEITFTINDRVYTGIAEAINDAGNLIVKKPDGDISVLQSGEISVRFTEKI